MSESHAVPFPSGYSTANYPQPVPPCTTGHHRLSSNRGSNLNSYDSDADAASAQNGYCNPANASSFESSQWSPRASCPQPARFQVPFFYPPPTLCPRPPWSSSSSTVSTPATTANASPTSTRRSPLLCDKPYPHHSPPSLSSSPTTSAPMDTSQDFIAVPNSPPTYSSSAPSRPYPSPTGSPITTLPPPTHVQHTAAVDPFRHVKDTLIAQVQKLPLPYYHHELIIKGENAGFPNVLYFDIRHTYFPNVPPSRSILVQWEHPNTRPIVLAQVYARAFPLDAGQSPIDQIASVLCRVPCAGILTELHPDMPRYLPSGTGWMHSGCDLVYYPTSRVYRETMRHAKCQWLIDPRRKTLKCDKCTGMLTRMNRERVEVEGKPSVDDKYKRYHPSLLPYLKEHYSTSSPQE
ncbi:hypothetical protein BCR44DRAFT_38435 [Catenaria anguillulae PL171]|uniref:Uncharacterized protein n=1 Tax=Catenaria anguillulae PL171 TaxID=765915 RepID=A0A1Y2HRT2_9FUNG|nr:hypothetical protein BCR44DRAFT_38435 [Catenaria anguillulae PL171]